MYYTCQLFLSEMREIFLSISPEFLKTFQQLLNIVEDVLTTSEHCCRIPKDVLMISEGCRMLWCEAQNLGKILLSCYFGLKCDI